VVDALSSEFPRVKVFATLSPIPSFRAWLAQECARRRGDLVLTPEREALASASGTDGGGRAIAGILADSNAVTRPQLGRALRAPLERLCAVYLLDARRPDGRALDTVANFHLSNGARVERINWLADTSPKGLEESAGLMVNYRYALPEIETNHEAYARERIVAASERVAKLARGERT
jgi:malonyl-CoA decarboxylase